MDVMNESAKAEKRWICTNSGIKFFPLEPRHCDLLIEDIAHHLSRVTRYTGAIELEHYSVAEHSVLVSSEVERRAREQGLPEREVLALAKWGLLHDATEAYIADVSRPVKRQAEMAPYREIEVRLLKVIEERFGLTPGGEPNIVKQVDTEILGSEVRVLLPNCDMEEWQKAGGPVDPIPGVHVTGWPPSLARARFLEHYTALWTGGDR